jgi:L-malate glycosyltransferase
LNKTPILLISSVSGIGGAEVSLLEFAKHIDRERFLPCLLTTEEGPIAQRFRESGFQVFYGSFPYLSRRRPWIYAKSAISIVRIIRQNQIRLVVVNCDHAIPLSVLASKIAGVPIICRIHDTTRSWALPRMVGYLNRSDRIIANSISTANYCLSSGMDPKRIQVIYPYFNLDRFYRVGETVRSSTRQELGIPSSVVAIGLVGQILQYKGHEDLIEAAAIVASEFPHVMFFIVGDDSLSSEPGFTQSLKDKISKLELDTKIVFTGFREDIPAIMAAMDIIAVPSWTEAFGRVIIEALAVKRPVVAANVGGIPELIQSGKNGYLIPPHQPAVLAESILMLCKDSNLRREMGKCGLSAIGAVIAESPVKQFETLIRSLIRR